MFSMASEAYFEPGVMAAPYGAREVPQKKRNRKPKSISEKVEKRMQRQNCVCRWVGCTAVLPDAAELRDHLEDHIGRNLELYECQWEGCDFGKRKKRDHLKSHVRKHHKFVAFFCPRCEEGFVRDQELRKHLCPMAASSPNHSSPGFSSEGAHTPDGAFYSDGVTSPESGYFYSHSPVPSSSGSFQSLSPPPSSPSSSTSFSSLSSAGFTSSSSSSSSHLAGYDAVKYNLHPLANFNYRPGQPQRDECALATPVVPSHSRNGSGSESHFGAAEHVPTFGAGRKRDRDQDDDVLAWLDSIQGEEVQPQWNPGNAQQVDVLWTAVEEDPQTAGGYASAISQCAPFFKKLRQNLETSSYSPDQDILELFEMGLGQGDHVAPAPTGAASWEGGHGGASEYAGEGAEDFSLEFTSVPITFSGKGGKAQASKGSAKKSFFQPQNQDDSEDEDSEDEEEDRKGGQEAREGEADEGYTSSSSSGGYVTSDEEGEDALASKMRGLSVSGAARRRPRTVKELLSLLDTLIRIGDASTSAA